MRTRIFPGTDLEVSLLGLGCNNFGPRLDEAEAAAVTAAAIDAGINHFDTANSYSAGESERLLGRALGRRRGDVAVATKFGHPMGPEGGGTSPDLVRAACEGSLKRLGTDYIDLYYIHFPDENTPIADTLGALETLVSEGKVRHIACSNFSRAQIEEAVNETRVAGTSRLIATQSEWSLLERGVEEEIVPTAEEQGMGVVPFFPLASGVLTGKYRANAAPPADSRAANWKYFSDIATPERLATVDRLAEVVQKYDRSLVELALGWVASQPVVTSVLAGATSVRQVEANAAAIGWQLSAEESAAVDAAL